MKRIALAAVLLVALVGPARAGFDEGLAAYYVGDFETALKEFLPLAEKGDANAQFGLGVMYHDGRGVPQDDAEAVRWYPAGVPLARLGRGLGAQESPVVGPLADRHFRGRGPDPDRFAQRLASDATSVYL